MDTGAGLDRDRLHMEAALLATKADVREEIDRLKAHVDAARTLACGARGARAAGWISWRRNSTAKPIRYARNRMRLPVTAIGLDLKVLIDQFREQVQNLE
jgi:uncharacterized protein (TIGR00255 family)